jgi:hypothetical protein
MKKILIFGFVCVSFSPKSVKKEEWRTVYESKSVTIQYDESVPDKADREETEEMFYRKALGNYKYWERTKHLD